MQKIYIEKINNTKLFSRKIKMEQDNLKISYNLEKEKNIRKLIHKLLQNNIEAVVISKDLYENEKLINYLNSNNIRIFDGKWLIKYLSIEILDYIIQKKNLNKVELEIAITTNEITELGIELIKKLSKQYKRITVVTSHIDKLRKIEKEIYEKEGILILVSNNQKKSLLKPAIILNLDFNKVVLNKYKINENSIIINLEGDMKIENKRFNGICINDYDIETGREEIIWRENIKAFRTKDLIEANYYCKDTFNNIHNKLRKSKLFIKELYGNNGIIEF